MQDLQTNFHDAHLHGQLLIYAGLIDKPNSSMDFMSVFPIKSGSIRDLGRPESFWRRSGVVPAIVTAFGVLGAPFSRVSRRQHVPVDPGICRRDPT
ncbi:MAG: hypothetical protein VW495_01180 [Rhodobiaceae bacterium]